MEACIKKKLEERNDRIIKSVVKKAEKVCPGAIALIGIAGSFHSGDIYEKSDLDLCIVANDDNALYWRMWVSIYIVLLGEDLKKWQSTMIRSLQNYLS